MYAYDFIGKRYDVGNMWRTALRRSDLKDEFLEYLVRIVEKEVGVLGEVAAGRE